MWTVGKLQGWVGGDQNSLHSQVKSFQLTNACMILLRVRSLLSRPQRAHSNKGLPVLYAALSVGLPQKKCREKERVAA